MAKIVLIQTHTATVVETTRVVLDVPDGMIPQEFVDSIEEGGDAGDAIWEAIDAAYMDHNGASVFVGSNQCRREYNWGQPDMEYTIEGEA